VCGCYVPDSFVDSGAIYIVHLLYSVLIFLPPYVFTSLRIDLFRFQLEVTKPGFSFVVFILCCSIFCHGCIFAFVVFDLVSSVLSQQIG